jgi:hypothetical protein
MPLQYVFLLLVLVVPVVFAAGTYVERRRWDSLVRSQSLFADDCRPDDPCF